MDLLVYILAYPIIWILSKLPFRLLYVVSDFVYFVVYKLLKFRVKVVRKNLNIAFPFKTQTELLNIEKKFYKHFCDIFLEMIKSYGMSEKEMKQRMTFTNLEIFKEKSIENRSAILMCGHYASYEWLLSLAYNLDHKPYALYTPLSNKYFDRLVQKVRMKHKSFLLSRYRASVEMKRHKDQGLICCYGFAADQVPNNSKSYRRPFLGLRVPVFTGAERMGKQLNAVILFANIQKIKRGYYQTTFEILSDNPTQIPDYQITDMFFERLNQQIYKQPEYYLWTHNRFKRM
ncbi:lipid A biosynthesis protein [Capnocytophaga stomatis]|uniref:lysophospholipid acyltransferase family protein n=1 Tax=Capnocytophaga stomatis TaxID=1848904 RepID=UPI00194F0C41|nr:lysophospholipid acyltransferase family protein [Capnocytophaga stomatis]GIJ96412.1 lipid A biosynthesis protein [Capnocytophaga stomatis]